MKKTFFTASLLAALVTTAGCSVVKVSEAGKRVSLISSDNAYNCQRVGNINTSVLDNVLFVPRNTQKIQSDLDKLARDQAVLMHANSLVRVSTIEGQGKYIAYNCN